MTVPALALRAEASRKALHLATAALPIAWAGGYCSPELLRGALAAAAAVALTVEFWRRHSARTAHRFTAAVGPLLRPHERHALTGATWLALAMAGVAWLAPEAAAIAALWAAAVGDASAAIVGRTVTALRRHAPGRKTIAGSLAAALTTALGIVWLLDVAWPLAAALGAVAALAERPSRPFDDNLRVAVAVALAATALGLR